MARIVKNNKGFKVIALSHEEGERLGWGLWHRNEEDTEDICSFICMDCNEEIEGELYYIAAMNDVMCEDCYNKWLATTTRYSEDIPFEERQFNYIWSLLNISSCG